MAGFWTELHPRASFLFPATAGSLQVQSANLAKFLPSCWVMCVHIYMLASQGWLKAVVAAETVVAVESYLTPIPSLRK